MLDDGVFAFFAVEQTPFVSRYRWEVKGYTGDAMRETERMVLPCPLQVKFRSQAQADTAARIYGQVFIGLTPGEVDALLLARDADRERISAALLEKRRAL